MKHFLVFLLIMIGASPGWSKPTMSGPSYLGSAQTVTWQFDTTTEASPTFGARGLCVATFIRAGSETVTLYQTTASTATGGTSVATFSATTTSPTTLTIGQPNLYAVSDGATAGGSLTIHCSPLQVSGVGQTEVVTQARLSTDGDVGVIYQVTDATDGSDCATGTAGSSTAFCGWDGSGYVPVGVSASGLTNPITEDLDAATFDIMADMGTVGTDGNFPRLDITNPATTSMGAGVTWGTDQTAKNRPSGSEIDTRNHLMGWFYNKSGVNGTIVKQCQPAWDWSHETNFRTTASTEDDQWVELNMDLFPPEYTAVPTGVSGTPTVGEYMTLSSGSVIKVLAWSGGTLTFRQSHGDTCAADAQTFTGVTSGATGTLASTTYTGESSANFTRMLQFEWDTADDMVTKTQTEVLWTFDTFPNGDTRPSTMRLRNGAVGVYMPDQLTRRFTVWNDGSYNSSANVLFEHDRAGQTGLAQNADILEIRHDWGANANSASYARGIHFLAPLNGGSTTVNRFHQIHIEDMAAFGGTDSSVIMIEPQTGGDGSDGNVTFEGGNYTSGHLTFGAEGASGDHLWRDQTNERWRTETDSTPSAEDDGRALAEMVALNGTVALDTDAIASGACDTSDTGIAATGVLATDVLSWSFNADVTAITGYAPVTTGALSIYAYPGSGTVSFKVCNPTADSITPGSAVTLNWNVVR